MDRNALHYFAAVAESQSFQAAAQQLGVPKSTLSRKISELEKQLGVQLLNRTTRQVSLTEVGDLIYQHGLRMDEEAEQVLALALNSNTQPRGTLRLTAPITLGRIAFGKWIPDFRRLYPDIQLDIHLSDNYEDLVKHQIDVAIRVGSLEDSSLISRPLCTTPKWLLCSPEYARLWPLTNLEQLPHHHLLALKNEQLTVDRWQFMRNGRRFDQAIHPAIVVNDMMTLLELLKADTGIALVPRFAAHTLLESSELVRILPEIEGEPATFHIIYHKRQNLPHKVRVFIDYLIEATRDETLFAE